jgi:hypothetical protein
MPTAFTEQTEADADRGGAASDEIPAEASEAIPEEIPAEARAEDVEVAEEATAESVQNEPVQLAEEAPAETPQTEPAQAAEEAASEISAETMQDETAPSTEETPKEAPEDVPAEAPSGDALAATEAELSISKALDAIEQEIEEWEGRDRISTASKVAMVISVVFLLFTGGSAAVKHFAPHSPVDVWFDSVQLQMAATITQGVDAMGNFFHGADADDAGETDDGAGAASDGNEATD